MTAAENRYRRVPSTGAGWLAIVAMAIPSSFGIALAAGLIGATPAVMLVTLTIATVAGGPAFVWLRRRSQHRAALVVAAGFATGAAAPLLLAIAAIASQSGVTQNAASLTSLAFTIACFGVAGMIGALAAWQLSLWLSPTEADDHRVRRLLVAAGTVLVAAAAFLVPQLAMDRSCHNPLRGGRTSIGPFASFELHLPQPEWPELDWQLHRFAQERGWIAQIDHQPETGDMPWFQQSLCTEAGTQIFVMNNAPEPLGLNVSAYQPQGGESWQLPLRALQRKLEARWPGSTSYRYDPYSAPRPPWAPPTPAPSSAIH